MGQVVTMALLKKYLLECSIGHILDVAMNPNSSPVQCSVIASAVLTRDRVLQNVKLGRLSQETSP